AAATSYRRYDDTGGDPVGAVRAAGQAVEHKAYHALRRSHVTDHAALFGGVKIDLGTSPAAALPTDERIAAGASAVDPALAALFNYTPPSTNPYDRVTDIDAALGVNTNEGGVSAIADWNVGFATLTSVSAWRFWNWDAANDRDYTGIPVQLSQHIPSRQDQYSQELRLASNGEH
ncbi:glycosyl hydrolase family 95 catalytic domain-containing protein, partial [Pseudomonas sp. EA_5y_Pfl2_R50]|uniref:glycosyl hydrolase family 95 catalytic domain-containing protein n=1 Tax=Pseudomonas sp. EA_5y_Pfl2_R50 TaxID=3088691 RepID=UPI00403FAECF